jgi:hypothetical protein
VGWLAKYHATHPPQAREGISYSPPAPYVCRWALHATNQGDFKMKKFLLTTCVITIFCLLTYSPSKPALAASDYLVYPVTNSTSLTSNGVSWGVVVGHGDTGISQGHLGVDYAPLNSNGTCCNTTNAKGKNVYAVVNGVIEELKSYGDGYAIKIRHSYLGGNFRAIYRHVVKANWLTVGGTVNRGDVIATIADTVSFGYSHNHLHFEIRETNLPIDPALYQYVAVTEWCNYDNGIGYGYSVQKSNGVNHYCLQYGTYENPSTFISSYNATSAVHQCENDGNNAGVYLYEHANFEGRCTKFTPSTTHNTNPSNWYVGNDKASSIKIVGFYLGSWYVSYNVKVFENASYSQGNSKFYAAQRWSQYYNFAAPFPNDSISSIEINSYTFTSP